MYRHKAKYIFPTILILFTQIAPVTAEPIPTQITTTQSTDTVTAITSRENTETTAATEAERAEQARAEAEAAAKQAQAEAEAAAKQAQAEKIMRELDTLGEELESLDTDYFAESAKLAVIRGSLNETQEKLHWFEAELEAQHQILNNRVANIYKHGRIEALDALISKASFKDVFTRLGLLLKIGEQDADILQNIQEQKQKVETAKNVLDQLYRQQEEVTVQLEERRKVIEAKIKQQADLLASIDEKTRAILEQKDAERRRQQVDIINNLLAKTESDRISLQPGTVGFESIQYLGIPYVWGGESPEIGLDCSGLVKVVFEKFGIELPHYSRSQAKLGISVGYEELRSGDLVFFGNPIHHVGIYLGEGYYIHAPKRNDFVKISRMSDRSDHAGARRIMVGTTSLIPQSTIQ